MKKQSKRQLEKGKTRDIAAICIHYLSRKLLLVFNRHDVEETGYLNKGALYQALLALKLPVQPTDIEDIFDSVGRKKEGTIGMDDFINIVNELQVCFD